MRAGGAEPRASIRRPRPQPPALSRTGGSEFLARVDVHSCWCLEDHPCLLRVDAVGAGVVDEETEAVGSEPDVAAFAALARSVARVGLPAVVSSAERAGVVGAGLVRRGFSP
jgi:hypothetical protein